MSSEIENKSSSHGDEDNKASSTSQASHTPAPVTGSAAFQAQYVGRDIAAGLITGAMAIPLSIGIAMMSDYPIKVGLATVAFASFVGWINAWFRPGNFIGSPGIAAGLAPVLALGVANFGIQNMAFCIFLTAIMQAIIWQFNWQRYLLIAVPVYLVEGLLAGVGLKILLRFFQFSYEIPEESVTEEFWNDARIQMCSISLIGFLGFVYLFTKFKDTQPAVPYFALIISGVILAQVVRLPDVIEVQFPDCKIKQELKNY